MASSSTGSVGTSSMGSSVGTTSSTSTGTSGASVGTSASTGMNASGPSSTNGSTGTPNNTGFTGLSYSNGTWSPNSNSLGTLSLGTPGLSGFASNNFGTGWSDNGNSSEPVMTVDEVYGKGNQSIVESQGDYEASSNEKSNVETSTFGKQDDIAVTPVSITENKGEVENDNIQSIEGLDFQQKDKANQEVMEAKKSRDNAEADDKSNQMRNQIKAITENEAEVENEAEADAFKVGDIDEDLASVQNELEQASKVKNDITTKAQEYEEALNEAEGNVSKMEASHEEMKGNVKAGKDAIGRLVSEAKNMVDGKGFIEKGIVEHSKAFSDLKGKVAEVAKSYGIDIGDISKADDLVTAVNVVAKGVNENLDNALKKSEENLGKVKQQRDEVAKKSAELYEKAYEADKSFEALRAKYNDIINSKFTEAPVETSVETKADTETPSYKANIEAARNEINNSDLPEETKSQALETINNVEENIENVNKAADDLAANPENPATIEAYVNAITEYNKNLKNATKDNSLKNTDFNKTFTEMVAKANDFEVTLADGSKQSFADFAAEMATKSPALAKGLYEAKANAYEEAGHTILAQIERAKANMVTTWLGSKFTFADNQVRAQFNQMAKTDMRATYATYNNVLNDPNATPEAKADAEAQISQANALMTASAALQASTGFFSGIGDSMRDGVYGVTDPNALTVSQKSLNAVNNFIRITLGLGVTPGANEAYQNMYYLAGAKANNSALFTTDFDSDGFALCQEYGNNAAVGMIVGAGELATGITLFFNPATAGMGLNLAIDSVQTFIDGLYGVQRDARKSMQYSSQVLSYLQEAKNVAAETNNVEVVSSVNNVIDNAISQIENFELKADEVGSLDNWLEGSGSNTADNGKFNQALSYDEWLKLIEADPTMQEYAKKITAEKK